MVFGGAVAALLVACQGSPPSVDVASVQRAEARLLSPFQVEQTLVADKLDITMTANFYSRLALPSTLPGVQTEETNKLDDGSTEYVLHTNARSPLQFELEKTRFFVMDNARVLVLGGRNDMTLKADLSGNVSIVDKGGARRDTDEVRIADGSYHVTEKQAR